MNDGSTIQDGHESNAPAVHRLSSSELETQRPSVRSEPGILIFSRRQQRLLHMNHRALELTGHINQTEIGAVKDIRLAPVRDLNAQIHEALDSRKETDIPEILEFNRVIVDAGIKILVRGFGLTGRHLRDGSRIVIVLDEITPPQEHLSGAAARASLPRAVAPSPKNQHGDFLKEVVSEVRKWGVPGPALFLEQISRTRTSENEQD